MKRVTGVIIGASRDSIHTIKKAREQGIYVVALDGNPDAEGFHYADKTVVCDISNLIETCKTIEEIKPDFVIPIPIGRYLSTTGYVNEKYGLKGIKYNAAKYSTDKYIFHEKMKGKGLRTIQCHLINKKTDISDISIEYPAIMKPRFGSGSRDVFYITSNDEVKQAYKNIMRADRPKTGKHMFGGQDFILEQAVTGEEYGVDGAVMNGNMKVTLIRKKSITPFPIRQAVASFSVDKEKNIEIYNEVHKYLQKVVETLEYDDCLINADIIMNDNGIFVIEIAPRPSGHYLHDVFVPITTGVDIAKEYIKFLLGKDYRFESENIKCMEIRFFDFEDVIVKRVPDVNDLKWSNRCNIKEWKCNIHNGDFMDKVINGHSIMGRGYFIIDGTDETDLREQSKWILSQFQCEKI